MSERRAWWRHPTGVPKGLAGPAGGLCARPVGSVRLDLAVLVVVSVVTGITTQASLLIVPVGAAVLLLCAIGPVQVARVIGLHPSASGPSVPVGSQASQDR